MFELFTRLQLVGNILIFLWGGSVLLSFTVLVQEERLHWRVKSDILPPMQGDPVLSYTTKPTPKPMCDAPA